MRLVFSFLLVVLFVFSGSSFQRASAEALLADLDLSGGTWEMVCVSVHNHNSSPLQHRLGTFAMQSLRIMREMQQNWHFRPTYDDYCDYHFVLKFYREKKLMKTLRVNAVCNYISEGVLSYEFDPDLLLTYESHYKKLPWSLVRYKDLNQLRNAVPRLIDAPFVYIYQDVNPYLYDGYFVSGTPFLPWHVDRDSVLNALQGQLNQQMGTGKFYAVPYIFFVSDNREQISLRFLVYCSEELSRKCPAKDMTASWRSHMDYRDPEERIELVVIGVDDKNYFKIVDN